MLVANLETKNLHGDPSRDRTIADRKRVLDTYAECLRAVRSPDARSRDAAVFCRMPTADPLNPTGV